MSNLGKGSGIFKLEDSEHNVGSYFTFEDVCEILEIEPTNELFSSEWNCISTDNLIDENDLYKIWGNIKKKYSEQQKIGRSSFDEYVLKAILLRTLPDVMIEQQVKVDKMNVDFLIEYQGQKMFVEYDGPSHFISQYGTPQNPIYRIQRIQEITGIKCVSWPYWIQRSSQNVRALFDNNIKGRGALWSSNAHFSNFEYDNAADIIIELSKNFNAISENGIGYFYDKWDPPYNKPEHPIIDKIKKRKRVSIDKLIPKGATDKKFWLPKSLWHMV